MLFMRVKGILHADSEDSGQSGTTPRLIRVFAELIALCVCSLIFQRVLVMEQTERSDALIHRNYYLNFSSWGVKFCKECKLCHVKTCLQSFQRRLAKIGHYSLQQKMA